MRRTKRFLYRCGCKGKYIVGHRPAPEYQGIFSVHQDGTRCSSMFEGDLLTHEAQVAQAKLTDEHYRKLLSSPPAPHWAMLSEDY